MNFNVGDVVLYISPFSESCIKLYLVQHKNAEVYEITFLDGSETVLSNRTGETTVVPIETLNDPVFSLAFIRPEVTNSKPKCVCPILELVNLGCKCGGC